jgi:hypothetical protein
MTLDELERLMQSHDWLYGYSDDHRVWQAGKAAEARLERICQELMDAGHEKEVRALWNRYCPQEARRWM